MLKLWQKAKNTEIILKNHLYSRGSTILYREYFAGSWGHNLVSNSFDAIQCKTNFVERSMGVKFVGKLSHIKLRETRITRSNEKQYYNIINSWNQLVNVYLLKKNIS